MPGATATGAGVVAAAQSHENRIRGTRAAIWNNVGKGSIDAAYESSRWSCSEVSALFAERTTARVLLAGHESVVLATYCDSFPARQPHALCAFMDELYLAKAGEEFPEANQREWGIQRNLEGGDAAVRIDQRLECPKHKGLTKPLQEPAAVLEPIHPHATEIRPRPKPYAKARPDRRFHNIRFGGEHAVRHWSAAVPPAVLASGKGEWRRQPFSPITFPAEVQIQELYVRKWNVQWGMPAVGSANGP